jgi:hypothetical protein
MIGLVLFTWAIIVHIPIAKAENVFINVDIPSAGSLTITVLNEDSSQTTSNSISFTNVTTSDTDLFERNTAPEVGDLIVTVQTNVEMWHLTQYVSPDQLTNASGNSINLFWKINDQSSYSMMGSQQNPDLLGNAGVSSGYSLDLDYALQVPTSTPAGAYGGTVTYTLVYN